MNEEKKTAVNNLIDLSQEEWRSIEEIRVGLEKLRKDLNNCLPNPKMLPPAAGWIAEIRHDGTPELIRGERSPHPAGNGASGNCVAQNASQSLDNENGSQFVPRGSVPRGTTRSPGGAVAIGRAVFFAVGIYLSIFFALSSGIITGGIFLFLWLGWGKILRERLSRGRIDP